jgi:hypothetical protein
MARLISYFGSCEYISGALPHAVVARTFVRTSAGLGRRVSPRRIGPYARHLAKVNELRY